MPDEKWNGERRCITSEERSYGFDWTKDAQRLVANRMARPARHLYTRERASDTITENLVVGTIVIIVDTVQVEVDKEAADVFTLSDLQELVRSFLRRHVGVQKAKIIFNAGHLMVEKID